MDYLAKRLKLKHKNDWFFLKHSLKMENKWNQSKKDIKQIIFYGDQ